MLSTFEAALLERHLRRCPSCRAFAASATMQTQLLRDALLEQPLHPIALPTRPRRAVPRSAAGALGACLAAAAAALLVLTPATQQQTSGALSRQTETPDPALVVFAANPTPASKIEVPRLKVEPASILDGPVRGRFSLPV